MKIKNLLFGAMALIAVATGCQKNTLDGSSLQVDKTKVEVSKEQGEQVLNVTADCKWVASTDADWFTVDPAEGSGNGQVTIYVQANEGAERTATLHFQKSTTMKVSFDVTVTQAAGRESQKVAEGDGTKEKPYNAVQANKVGNDLADNATTPNAVYIRGFVKKIKTQDTETDFQKYQNMTFYITVGDDLEGDDFYCYQMNYAEGAKFPEYSALKVGDDVVIYAQITKYVGTSGAATVETVGKGASYLVSINGEETTGGEPTPIVATDATVAEFNAAAVSTSVYYRLTGTVSGTINTQYGNFDLVDETGTVYVYGLTNIAEVKDKLVKGAKITVIGTRGEYSGKIEVLNGRCEKIEEGDTPEPIVATDATVAEFIAAANPEKYYRLTGKVGGSINTTYGNFDLTDATGTVYVYGLDNIAEVKDKLLKDADIVITGTYLLYQKEGQPDKVEVINGHCESISGGDTPEPGPTPTPGTGAFDSNVKWTLGTNAYDNTSDGSSKQSAVVNGEQVSNLLKLGTSKVAGDATVTVPAGTTKVSFYGLSWKGKAATCVIKLGGTELFKNELTANDGVANNPPYTITVTDADKYTIDLGTALAADTTVTVTTDGANTRIILFGIKAE